MRKLLGVSLAVAGIALMTGCAGFVAPVMPVSYPTLFANFSAPIDTDAEQTPVGNRVGKASSITALGLFTFGDASLNTAVQEGRLRRIDYIDYEYLNVAWLFQRFTTRVHGE